MAGDIIVQATQLKYSGFIWIDGEGHTHSVYEKRLLFKQVYQIALQNYSLFSRYDLGAAEELRFSDCCHIG